MKNSQIQDELFIINNRYNEKCIRSKSQLQKTIAQVASKRSSYGKAHYSIS